MKKVIYFISIFLVILLCVGSVYVFSNSKDSNALNNLNQNDAIKENDKQEEMIKDELENVEEDIVEEVVDESEVEENTNNNNQSNNKSEVNKVVDNKNNQTITNDNKNNSNDNSDEVINDNNNNVSEDNQAEEDDNKLDSSDEVVEDSKNEEVTDNNQDTFNQAEYDELKKQTYPTFDDCINKGIQIAIEDDTNTVLGSYCETLAYHGKLVGYKLYIKYENGELKQYIEQS